MQWVRRSCSSGYHRRPLCETFTWADEYVSHPSFRLRVQECSLIWYFLFKSILETATWWFWMTLWAISGFRGMVTSRSMWFSAAAEPYSALCPALIASVAKLLAWEFSLGTNSSSNQWGHLMELRRVWRYERRFQCPQELRLVVALVYVLFDVVP